jgi:hypothetical protein
VGLSLNNPIPVISMRAEGYFAVTSNSIHLGGRYEVGISLGIEAHGFIQVDAMVQFRPFYFEARISAGFAVSAGGFSFASVTLEGSISGPGPIVIRGSLSVSVFLFSLSWSEQFTLGSGPSDTLPAAPPLLVAAGREDYERHDGRYRSIQSRQLHHAHRLGSPQSSAFRPARSGTRDLAGRRRAE